MNHRYKPNHSTKPFTIDQHHQIETPASRTISHIRNHNTHTVPWTWKTSKSVEQEPKWVGQSGSRGSFSGRPSPWDTLDQECRGFFHTRASRTCRGCVEDGVFYGTWWWKESGVVKWITCDINRYGIVESSRLKRFCIRVDMLMGWSLGQVFFMYWEYPH